MHLPVQRRVVIVPDLEVPNEDRKAFEALIAFIEDRQPDEVILIGALAAPGHSDLIEPRILRLLRQV